MKKTAQRLLSGSMPRRILSLALAVILLLSLWPNLPAKAAEGVHPKVTDLVQLKVGDSLTTMNLYRSGVYEGTVAVEAGKSTAAVTVNGEDTQLSTEITASEAGQVTLRLRDGALTQVGSMPCTLVGNFSGLDFLGQDGTPMDITNWNPADANGDLDYLGGGLYSRTFRFQTLAEEVTLYDGGYKVAFNHSWDYSLGEGYGNIALTIPAGTSSLTVLVDEINQKVYDSVRTPAFEVKQNSGSLSKPALTTTVSLIGPVRGDDSINWVASEKGFEFTPISDTLYRYQKTFAPGSYSYKCVFDYTTWYEAEGNRDFTLTKETNVVFLYDTLTGRLYDSVVNTSGVSELLGMEVAPAVMEVTDNANGTTTFIAAGEDGKAVTLNYCLKSSPDKVTSLYLGKIADGAAKSEDIFLGDDAIDLLYWYDMDGQRTLDGSNPTVTVNGTEYSNYTRAAFTGRLITVPGTLPGPSWDPAANAMTYEGNGRYIYTFKDVAPANYEFKIATGTWGENYGLGGTKDGPNIPVTVPSQQDVSVYYSDFSHRAACSVSYVLADISLVGTGIPADTKLTDDYLLGIYSVTVPMAPGTYTDVKIVYGDKEYAFQSIELQAEKEVTFFFDPLTGIFYCNASDVPLDTDHIYYNSKDAAYKSVYGAVATGEEVTFRIDTGVDATSVTMVITGLNAASLTMTKDGEAKDGVQKWSVTTSFDKLSENSYYFAVSNGSAVKIYADDDGNYGEGTVTDLTNIKAYDLVVYQSGFETPDWMKNAVVYQIFPDRFFDGAECNNFAQLSARGAVDYEYITDWYTLPENPEQEGLLTEEEYKATGAHYGDGQWSNEIYGGDLKGIIDRIDYLKALGVNVIYLNPVFSSISSHRYDACDYTKIDPILGTMGSFEELVKVAEENDMHIILDGVFNHVSDDSIYFDRYYKFLGTSEKIGAYPYWAYVYDYMAEKEADQAAAEAAAKAYFTEKYGITDYSYTEWFEVTNTVLIEKETQEPAVDTIGLRAGKTVYGYEGWWGYDSMPVILSTNGSEYQTGNWAEEIIYNEEETSVTQFWLNNGMDGWRLDVANEVSDETWQNFRRSVKALNDSQAVIVGEIWTDATKYLMGDMYDSVMNYMFRNAVTSFAMGADAAESTNTLERLRERYPKEAFYAMMNLVASHDTSRLLSYLDGIGDDRTDKSVEATFPTYEGTSDLAKQRQYLVAFLQFTYAGAPTIYYGDEIGMVGADDPDDRRGFTWGKGDQGIVTWYAKLANIRSQFSALRTGSVEPFAVDEHTMAYVRRDDADTLIVLANNAQEARQVTLRPAELGVDAAAFTDAISGTAYTADESGEVTVTLPGLRGVILAQRSVTAEVDQDALKPAYDPSYIVKVREAQPTLTHREAPAETKEATCTEAGLVGAVYCADCGKLLSAEKVLPALGHDFGAWTVKTEATCTKAGQEVRTCSRCGESETREIPVSSCATGNYADMSDKTLWYHDYLDTMAAKGWMNGTDGSHMEPNGTLTRAQFVTMLYRMAGTPEVKDKTTDFTDLVKSSWYYDAVIWAAQEKLVNGISEEEFAPDAPITREQLVLILYRAAGSPKQEAKELAEFADADQIASWAKDAVIWAVNGKLLQGSDGKLFPRDNTTRAETAAILLREAQK